PLALFADHCSCPTLVFDNKTSCPPRTRSPQRKTDSLFAPLRALGILRGPLLLPYPRLRQQNLLSAKDAKSAKIKPTTFSLLSRPWRSSRTIAPALPWPSTTKPLVRQGREVRKEKPTTFSLLFAPLA